MSPDETMQTARVLQHLNATGLTIVVVEHDVAFVREVAQRVTVLHQGRVFAEGHGRRDHRRPGRAPHLSGEGLSHGGPILAAEGLRSGYATGDVLQGVGIEVASRRDRRRARAATASARAR